MFYFEVKGLYGRTWGMGAFISSYDEAVSRAEAAADDYLAAWWLPRTAFITVRTIGEKGFTEWHWEVSNN